MGGEGPWAENCKAPWGSCDPWFPMGQRSSVDYLPSSSLLSFLPLCISPPRTSGSSFIWENLQPWGKGFPCCLLQTFPQEESSVEGIPQEAGKGIGSPWELGPSQGGRRLCMPQERASLWLLGWGCVRGGALDESSHSLCLGFLCQTVLALYSFSFNLQKKASDAISMPIWRKRKLRLTLKPLKWNCEHTWCHARAHCCSLARHFLTSPPPCTVPPSFKGALSPSRNVPDSFPCLGIQAFHKTCGLGLQSISPVFLHPSIFTAPALA